MTTTPVRRVRAAVDAVVRDEWARILSALMSFCRDLELAEDVLQDALLAALKTWPERGIPDSPRAWLLKTAQRKAIDRFRRAANFESKRADVEHMMQMQQQTEEEILDDDFPDDRLKLVFTCCHPALSSDAQVALTLRTVGGMATPEIAKAFLVTESTMAQRLVRAQRKIKSANIPYSVPTAAMWPERLQTVLSVIYLVFNEGYAASSGDRLVRDDLCQEAIRLAEILTSLLPDDTEIRGLLALMLLHGSRRPARSGPNGELKTLETQDRDLWDREAIGRGRSILIAALAGGAVGRYQIQAAISAIHSEAERFSDTDWKQICLLYEKLYELQPSPVVQLNAAVALSFAESPGAGLKAIEDISGLQALQDYQPYHAARADMLFRAGESAAAIKAYESALETARNEAERRFLQARLDSLRQVH